MDNFARIYTPVRPDPGILEVCCRPIIDQMNGSKHSGRRRTENCFSRYRYGKALPPYRDNGNEWIKAHKKKV